MLFFSKKAEIFKKWKMPQKNFAHVKISNFGVNIFFLVFTFFAKKKFWEGGNHS